MPDLRITPHAIQRFIERVRVCTEQEAEEALSTKAFHTAATLGRCSVRLGSGHRAVMRNGAVITVLPHGVHAIFASTRTQRNA
jgi:hypothetical protein